VASVFNQADRNWRGIAFSGWRGGFMRMNPGYSIKRMARPAGRITAQIEAENR
jgi:hypothetical protein